MKTLEGPQKGKRGDVVASRNHYGQHLRQAGRPKKRPTAARLKADEAMRIISDAWNDLAEEQRQRWHVAGPNVPSRKVLGKAGHLDGRGFFSKVNLPRARLGQKLLTEPPAEGDFGESPFVAFEVTNDSEGMALVLTLARDLAGEIFVRASPPCNAGKSRNWDYRVLGLLKAPVKGPNNITRLYVEKYDVPPVGKRIFIEARQQMNGWRGKPWKADAVVPPWKFGSERRKGRRSSRQTPGV